MAHGRPNRREALIAAAVRLVAHQGVGRASVRQIAHEAGVSEGALYRHFDSKDDLCRHAYAQIVADMAAQKERILRSTAPLSGRLHDWIRVTYEYFDAYPEAFTYVLLTEHDFSDSDIARRQGNTLTQLLADAVDRGQLPAVDPVLSMGLFTGLMLNVPRLINDGVLPGPAARYTEAAAAAGCAILGQPPATPAAPAPASSPGGA